MLTRINGVAFRNQEELDAWEEGAAGGRERDHRKIGKGNGPVHDRRSGWRNLPMFLPAGYTVWQGAGELSRRRSVRGYLRYDSLHRHCEPV